jgi:hypothetical protein
MKTIKEVHALVGQTFGSGKNVREVVRIEGIRESFGNFTGSVYWKRPGGKERKQPQWLPYFLQWLRKVQREENHTEVESCSIKDVTVVEAVEDIEAWLMGIPENTKIDGFISREDNKVTISFTVPTGCRP